MLPLSSFYLLYSSYSTTNLFEKGVPHELLFIIDLTQYHNQCFASAGKMPAI